MSVYRLWICFVEIYKTINKLNPEFMNNICKVKENKRFSQRTIQIKSLNSWPEPGYFRAKSFKVHGPKIWSNLPLHIRLWESLIVF